MSWDKAAWTAAEIEGKMPGIDAGKDLFAAGIRKGLTTKMFSGNQHSNYEAEVTGSGWVTSLAATGHHTSGNYGTGKVTITVDGTKTYSLTSTQDSGCSITFDPNAFVSGFDQIETTYPVEIVNENIVLSLPIRFYKSLSLKSNNSGYWPTSSITYILDSVGSGGGSA